MIKAPTTKQSRAMVAALGYLFIVFNVVSIALPIGTLKVSVFFVLFMGWRVGNFSISYIFKGFYSVCCGGAL